MLCKEKPKHKMSAEERESFLRWQDFRIKQLSFSINLFLGFAVASLAFMLARDGRLNIGAATLNPTLMPVLFWWSTSAVFGVIASLSRLVDFRYTARRIRGGRKEYYCLTKIVGSVTWVSFGCEVLAYCAGAYLFVQSHAG